MRKSRAGNTKHLARNVEWNKANREHINSRRRSLYAEKKAACPSKLSSTRKAQKLKQRYGLTLEQHEKLFVDQGNKCAICLTDDPCSKTGWHTDHDHHTKAVRGILCHPCNLMLGGAKDSTTTLSRAVAYLERNICTKTA